MISSVESEHQLGDVLFNKGRTKWGGKDASLMVRMKELERIARSEVDLLPPALQSNVMD